jgi:hypothetical protein
MLDFRLIVTITLALNLEISAQSWNWGLTHNKSDGYSRVDYIGIDENESIYALGACDSSILFGTYKLDKGNFLLRCDSNGNLTWAKHLPYSPTYLATSPDGFLYAAGNYTSTFNTLSATITHTAGTDFYIARYDPDGTEAWVLSFGGPGNQGLRGIASDSHGNIYLTGGIAGSDSAAFGNYMIHNPYPNGDGILILLRTNSLGHVTWAKQGLSKFTEGKYDINGLYVRTDGSDNPMVLAYTADTNCDTCSCWAIANFDGNGNLVNHSKFNHSFIPPIYGPKTIDFGSLGEVYGYSDNGPKYATRAYWSKYDNLSSLVWKLPTDYFGGSLAEFSVGSFERDNKQNVYLAGSYDYPAFVKSGDQYLSPSWFSLDSLSHCGDSDAALFKLNPDGKLFWARTLCSAGYEYVFNPVIGKNGNIFIAGSYDNYSTADRLVIGKDTLKCTSPHPQLFIAKLSSSLVLSNGPENEQTRWNCFPVPSTEFINFEGVADGDHLSVYSINGKQVAIEVDFSQQRITFSNPQTGVYLVKRTTNGISSYKRVILIK